MAETTGRSRLGEEYKRAKELLDPRTFRMNQLLDLVPELQSGENIFKEELTDGYYHLRLH